MDALRITSIHSSDGEDSSASSTVTLVLNPLEFVGVLRVDSTAKSCVLLQPYHADTVFICFIKCFASLFATRRSYGQEVE
jgi:hypothetical protein